MRTVGGRQTIRVFISCLLVADTSLVRGSHLSPTPSLRSSYLTTRRCRHRSSCNLSLAPHLSPACSLSGSDPLPTSGADSAFPVYSTPAVNTSERRKRCIQTRQLPLY